MVDEGTRKTLSGIPLLQTKAGPRDKDLWVNRLKEEYQALIKHGGGREKVFEDAKLEALLDHDLCQTQQKLAGSLGVNKPFRNA
ncbi:Ubiquitin-fold modifier-conjugating enzyme 1 [Eumeta japonica]|uniref:Ubiquitin-fold modifier-conjugating enzyme 1 n=1 Tax=Eumeta variegata TaxID=151549 RepID=A0A4C1Z3G8_EUMVA|nr:Ubiquitin-fold modifier-conjugating enzyme 1 [Eumeta japonica]